MMISANARIPLNFNRKGAPVASTSSGGSRPHTFRQIFAVRFTDYHVTAFRMHASKNQVAAVCKRGEVPHRPIRVWHSIRDVQTDPGWSLIDATERKAAMKCTASIRGAILKSMR